MLIFLILNYWITLLILADIAKNFKPFVELVIPIEISSKETKAEIEIHPETVEAKIKKCSI